MSDTAKVTRLRPDVHVMDLNSREVQLELLALVYEAGDVESRMLLELARRYVRFGQSTYGKVTLGDGRDWHREAKEESMDRVFYDLAGEFERHGQ